MPVATIWRIDCGTIETPKPAATVYPGCALRAGLRLFDLIDDAPLVFVEGTAGTRSRAFHCRPAVTPYADGQPDSPGRRTSHQGNCATRYRYSQKDIEMVTADILEREAQRNILVSTV